MKNVIVQVVQHLQPGGIETMALDLMQEYSKHSDVHIICLEGNKDEAIKAWPRLQEWQSKLHFLNKPAGLNPLLIFKLAKLLYKLKANILHSHHIGPLLYGGLAARFIGIKHLIHTEHDAWHLSQTARRKLQGQLLFLVRPIIVADCDDVASALLEAFPNSRPNVILNGIDTQRFTPVNDQRKAILRRQFNLPEQVFLLGCAARLEAVKDHNSLLHALSLLPEYVCLALAGQGSLKDQLVQTCAQLGIQDRVFFLGALDNMAEFYPCIDVFCLPSLNEGLPLSPLEAQACGIPAIVSNVGGCRNIVDPSTGILTPPNTPSALYESVLKIMRMNHKGSPREFVLNTGDLVKTAKAYQALMAQSRNLGA